MRRSSACLILLLLFTLQVGGVTATVHAAPLRQACKQAGYSHNNIGCVVVPRSGRFSVVVPGTKERLSGQGSAGTAGTQITVVKMPPPIAKKGGFGIRVRATGKFKPLHTSMGKLFRFNAAKNQLVKAKTITTTGIYQVTK